MRVKDAIADQLKPETINELLPMLRAKHKVSQQQVATKAQVHTNTISQIEKGYYEPSIITTMRIRMFFEELEDANNK